MTGTEPTRADSKRPAVFIHTVTAPDRTVLEPILWGLEEEGIPFELLEVTHASAAAIAKRAADASPLNVGIGIHNKIPTVCLHHRDLKEEQPLFTLRHPDLGPAPLRRLGMNAARLVKGEPLVFEDHDPGREAIENDPHPNLTTPDELVDWIARIVTEIIRKQ